MSRKKHISLAIVSMFILLAMAIGGTGLYLTDRDTAVNTVTVGDIKIDLDEPNWHDTYDVIPNQELPKDPQIKNTGVNDAIVFMTVQVPVEDITLTADNGTKGVKAPSELFWFKDTADGASTHANNFDSNWVHLDTKDTGADLSGSSRTYVFAYKMPLSANQTTSALFDKIQVKNFIENEIAAGTTEQIIINAYGIQASDVLENNVDLSDNLTNGNLSKIYDIFLKQAFNSTTPTTPTVEHENITYNVENADVQTFMATPAYDANDYSYTNMVNNSAFTVARPDRPATCEITVPSDAKTITITDRATGKVINDTVSGDTYTLVNYTPGQVLNYVVKNASNTPVKDGTITVEGTVRMIDGGGNTFNIRDIGGKQADGGKLKYGMIYRGSELEPLAGYGVSLSTESAEYFRDFLGIRAELDLRSNAELADYMGQALLDADYQHNPVMPYIGAFAFIPAYNTPGNAVIDKTVIGYIADKLSEGKPVYIHCLAGADRTGTVVALVEALCGVSQSDIDKEYELTSFAKNNQRLRTSDEYKNFMMSLNKMRGNTLQEKAVSWAQKMDISIDTINKLRNALIDGSPAPVQDLSTEYVDMFDSSDSNVVLNARINSSNTAVNYQSGQLVTGYIPVTPDSKIKIVTDKAMNTNSYTGQTSIYASDKTPKGTSYNRESTWKKSSDNLQQEGAVYQVWDFTRSEWFVNSAATEKPVYYVRICIPYNDINNIHVYVKDV